MEQILNRLDDIQSWKQNLKKTARQNKVSVCLASNFSPSKIRSFRELLIKRFKQEGINKKKFWIQNQLRAFYWTILVISMLHKVLIQDFQNQHWVLLEQIFIGKTVDTFQYEAKKLINSKKTLNSLWKQKQNILLSNLISNNVLSSNKINKWNDVARKLYESSNGQYFRTGKQCRQRWLNHLDPSKKHGQWTEMDDFIIAKTILTMGKKWSEIAKLLKSRTQHMVKNRYKSLIIKYRKIHGKNYNENAIFTKIVDSCHQTQKTQINEKQIYCLIKTRKNLHSQACTQSESNILTDLPKSIMLMNSFQIIQQQSSSQLNVHQKNQQKNQNQDDMNVIIRKQPQCQGLQSFLIQVATPCHNVQLMQIQSPNIWNYGGKTPYGFSPSAPMFLSFSQCDNYCDNKFYYQSHFSNKKIAEN